MVAAAALAAAAAALLLQPAMSAPASSSGFPRTQAAGQSSSGEAGTRTLASCPLGVVVPSAATLADARSGWALQHPASTAQPFAAPLLRGRPSRATTELGKGKFGEPSPFLVGLDRRARPDPRGLPASGFLPSPTELGKLSGWRCARRLETLRLACCRGFSFEHLFKEHRSLARKAASVAPWRKGVYHDRKSTEGKVQIPAQ